MHFLSQRPVDGDVVADGLDQLTGYVSQGLVAQDLDGVVVDFQCVVEGQLVFSNTPFLIRGTLYEQYRPDKSTPI